jgi:hypothetical protein
MSRGRRQRPPAPAQPRRSAGAAQAFAILLVFLVVSLIVYREALDGPFVSDDVPYLTMNPHVQGLSRENIIAILDPAGPVVPLAANYSPLHMLLHAAEWHVFGTRVRGYHVVNVVLHAIVSWLLILLLRTSRIPPVPAALAGVFFLLHPANVEAVAWISQLKTTSAMALALGALLAHSRRPALGALLFALALLAKPLAAFALPVVALLDWARDGRVRWRWIAIWGVAFAGLAVVEVGAFRDYGVENRPLDPDPLVWGRSIVALAMRYLAMATTSYGVSIFHELPRARSWLDPWWLAGVVALALLGWRTVWALRRRREEAAYWVWAAISFAPICQIFPFDFAMADRYLYMILPGLLGGGLLAGAEPWARAFGAAAGRPAGSGEPPRRAALARLALPLALLVAVAFGIRSAERAALWRAAGLLNADAAAHYPEGRQAHLTRARAAARAGDLEGVAAGLRGATAAGYDYLHILLQEPLFAGARSHPGVNAVFRELARTWIERVGQEEQPNQAELNMQAVAHEARGELAEAVRALERALEVGGRENELVRMRLVRVRGELDRRGRQPVGQPRTPRRMDPARSPP